MNDETISAMASLFLQGVPIATLRKAYRKRGGMCELTFYRHLLKAIYLRMHGSPRRPSVAEWDEWPPSNRTLLRSERAELRTMLMVHDLSSLCKDSSSEFMAMEGEA